MSDQTLNTIELEQKAKFRWIIGNLFFTSLIVLLAFIQMYVYYHNNHKSSTVCFATFFITLFGLLVVTRNIPMSVLTAMIISNLVISCGDLHMLNNSEIKEEKPEETREEKPEDDEHDDEHDPRKEVEEEITEPPKAEEEPIPEVEHKKLKSKYVTGSKFKPYLTGDSNDMAYPASPSILKFQN
tara:strand:- start:718 stop:1269 length:552 start_codon:yes stop_codon:yes gene_type:complete